MNIGTDQWWRKMLVGFLKLSVVMNGDNASARYRWDPVALTARHHFYDWQCYVPRAKDTIADSQGVGTIGNGEERGLVCRWATTNRRRSNPRQFCTASRSRVTARIRRFCMEQAHMADKFLNLFWSTQSEG